MTTMESPEGDTSRIVIVGAGLGGLRTAETLRKRGFTGVLTVLGDEVHPPYNRPPLSKQALAGGIAIDELAFRQRREDIDFRLGAAAVDCSPETVTTSDGSHYRYDALVIASGIHARSFPTSGPQPLTLRTIGDAEQLREQLRADARVVIIGAGFIGCEVAATARQLGCEVSVTSIEPEPMSGAIGRRLGAAMRAHHERHGVHFFLGRSVSNISDDGVQLDDGQVLAADVVVAAIGSLPNTGWLTNLTEQWTEMDISDGVLCDSTLQVVGAHKPCYAVGDIARFPNLRFDRTPRRIEHWTMPTDMGKYVGEQLAARLSGDELSDDPFTPLPSFWSDQYDLALQSFGMPGLGTAQLKSGAWDGDCIVEYHREDNIVGVIGVNQSAQLSEYRHII
jgi:3-phenylpropionate/trans-cinnamate dioxygenase ferredoxin reductase subunit